MTQPTPEYAVLNVVARAALPEWTSDRDEADRWADELGEGWRVVVLTDEQTLEVFHEITGFDTDI